MFTLNTTKRTEAARIVARLLTEKSGSGFLGLLDDKGYVPAEPKTETSLDRIAIAIVGGVMSMGHGLRTVYDWAVEPGFDFFDLLALKGQVPADGIGVLPRDGANDNWPVPGKVAA